MSETLQHGVLEARGLVKRFLSLTAVQDVDLTVHPGEVVGYLGPNGSGKSVTTRMLTGLLEPNEGHVSYDGRDIQSDLVSFHHHLGYVPEEPNLYPFLSGREYLELVGRLRGLPDGLLDHKAAGLLELFGMAHAVDQPMSGYSKGMKQKVLISAALLHDPDLLIFDEPESGLDVSTTLVFRQLIPALAERGKAVLYSSHLLEVVEKVCTRVLVLLKGRVIAEGPVATLRASVSASSSLEETFVELMEEADPRETASAIADLSALRP